MDEENASAKRKLLRGSVDFRHYLRPIIVISAVLCAIWLPLLIMLIVMKKRDAVIASVVSAVILCVPYITYYVSRCVHLLRDPSRYVFAESTLTDPHIYLNRAVYFFVSVDDGCGGSVSVETNAVFGLSSFNSYTNKRALIAYDAADEHAVVVKIIDK